MDNNQTPVMPTPAPKPQPVLVQNKPNKKSSLKTLLLVLLMLVLLAAAAYGGYWWRDRDANNQSKLDETKITSLEKELADLKAENADRSSEAADEAMMEPTEEQLANIQAAIETMNTAALEGYMAESVTVIIAASEGVGERTPAQAIADLEYLGDATDPWDFSLPAETLNEWGSGDYAQYFPNGAFVGQSDNDYVVSFIFDHDAKIKTVFMAVNADLL